MTTPSNNLTPARTRYAPSPTGNPHIGNIRTALFAYLWAKHTGGQFVLRIEDTDRKRTVEGSAEYIEASLRWLGLDWDEGPGVGGPYAPYVQSERLEFYQEIAKQLVEQGHAYYCYCTPERLEAVSKSRQAQHLPPGYDRRCRSISEAEKQAAIAEGITPTVRFKVPLEGKTTVVDLVVKDATVENATIQDAVLLKSDGYPTYHLAHLVDDHMMKMTDVIRAQEWLPSAPLHVMIYQALGWEMPNWLHVPDIMNPPGQQGKLSKRGGAKPILDYQELGYLPEALLNYLVLLGWSYDDKTEIFSKADLIEKFDISGIQPTPARFSPEKMLWMNGHYINHVLTVEDFTRRCLPFLAQAGLIRPEEAVEPGDRLAFITAVCALIKDKVKTLGEVPGEIDFLFRPTEMLEYPATDLIGKNPDGAAAARILDAISSHLETVPAEVYNDRDGLYKGLDALSTQLGLANRGLLFWPPRVALSGRTKSPDLMGMMIALGREETIKRLQHARQML